MQTLLLAAGIFLVIVTAFAIYILSDRKKTKKHVMERLRKEWGKEPVRKYRPGEFENISHYFRNKKYEGFQIDDITWNDLDMDRVFASMNHTNSFIGESYLYYKLRTPSFSSVDLEDFEEMVTWFREHDKEREETEYFFSMIGHDPGRYPIFDYIYELQKADIPGSNTIHFICIGMLIVSIILLFTYPQAGIILLILSIVFSCYIYIRYRDRVLPYLTACAVTGRLLKAAEGFAKLDTSWIEHEKIKEALGEFSKLRRNLVFISSKDYSTGSMGGLSQLLLSYLDLLTHIDLIQFKNAVRELSEHMPALEYLIDRMGSAEAAVAVASFRTLHQVSAIPVLHEDGELHFAAENMYHPLLRDPVPCSADTVKSVLVTGSNASGKSTFLKTAALQALLAQTVHTVTAVSYEACYFRICTSMSLRDDIEKKESYYIAEIRSIKRIIDQVSLKADTDGAKGCKAPVLCCVDEVLRGTNTVERISASSQILKWMATHQILCFAATHDIELTYILEGIFDNYHFEEQVTDEKVTFDYRLHTGRAMTRNAIRLLHLMGFDEEIISEAEKMAAGLSESSGTERRC